MYEKFREKNSRIMQDEETNNEDDEVSISSFYLSGSIVIWFYFKNIGEIILAVVLHLQENVYFHDPFVITVVWPDLRGTFFIRKYLNIVIWIFICQIIMQNTGQPLLQFLYFEKHFLLFFLFCSKVCWGWNVWYLVLFRCKGGKNLLWE